VGTEESEDTSQLAQLEQQDAERAGDEIQNELSQRVEALEDARNEERFIFIMLIIILLDVVFFTVIPTWTGPLGLICIEIVVLFILAKKMGMEDTCALIDKLLNRVVEKMPRKE